MFIYETWAERHILDITKRESLHTGPVKLRLKRLTEIEETRKAIMNTSVPLTERLSKLELLRGILDKV